MILIVFVVSYYIHGPEPDSRYVTSVVKIFHPK